jgi:predicted PurR-regulated permease PerM
MPTDKKPTDTIKKELSYIDKVWHTVAIAALLVVFILIARVAFNVLLMALAGALIAVYFHGLGDLIEKKTRLSRKFAMIISVATTIVILGALFWFVGAKVQSQIAQLSNSLPHTINSAKAKLAQTPVGQKVLEYSAGDNSKQLMETVQTFFSTSFGVLGDIYIVMFLGIFFTASPSLYKNGILMLVPANKKILAGCIMDRISLSLKGWLKGMLLSMVLITILITLGLTIIGVPAALVLGLITGITHGHCCCCGATLYRVANYCGEYSNTLNSKKDDQPAAGLNAHQPVNYGYTIRRFRDYPRRSAACYTDYFG